ncbi:MAG TPA: hypothetical protein DC047_11095 [Blastocatellia bacterium]|nr:hypothetical protein [Blastocatellia bacterium]
MKLPNAALAKVERKKITEYLLNAEHRYGASKARFFASFGFSLADWEALAGALLDHGRQFEVSEVTETIFGAYYEVEGELHTPDGRTPKIRSVWEVDHGMVAPRLITAYPCGKNYD